MTHKKKLLSAGLVFAMIMAVVLFQYRQAGTQKTGKVSKSGFYFNTVITICLYNTDNPEPIDECFRLARHYENIFSNTDPASDISRINANPGKYVTVLPETVELLEKAKDYAALSGSRFDITIGRLTDLWNFPEIAEKTERDDLEMEPSVLPDDGEIQKLLPHIDYRHIQINGTEATLDDSLAKIDLGGIAKGYIADRMKERLSSFGITSGYINLGGNVLTIGEKPDSGSYVIGIQKPFSPVGESIASLKVRDCSVVSAGTYERCYRVNGKLYHHILDTSTGYPVENNLLGVTVISKKSVDGDALSTICFALGYEKGKALIESLPDTEAIFINDNYELLSTSGIGDSVSLLP